VKKDARQLPGKGSVSKVSDENCVGGGCTAMPQIELETLLTWLDPTRKPLLVQQPQEYGG
jgi:hypothetical protein